jgi:hypothetical protein
VPVHDVYAHFPDRQSYRLGKDGEQGAAEGAAFIEAHIIQVTAKAFDDFAASGIDQAANRKLLGLS